MSAWSVQWTVTRTQRVAIIMDHMTLYVIMVILAMASSVPTSTNAKIAFTIVMSTLNLQIIRAALNVLVEKVLKATEQLAMISMSVPMNSTVVMI